MGWVREGSCPPERCKGSCCHHLGMWFKPPEDAEWLATRGLKVIEFDDRYLVEIPQVCPLLTVDGLCSIYGQPERPRNCEEWPLEPSHLLLDDNCGYTFIWQEDTVASV